MIPNPSLDCFYVVLNFWANLILVVLIKLFLYKKKRVSIVFVYIQNSVTRFSVNPNVCFEYLIKTFIIIPILIPTMAV